MFTNAAIGDFFKSLRKYFERLWLGFEPQCLDTFLSGLTKWGKILLALPAWVLVITLVLLRAFVLTVLSFAYILLVIVDFFADIARGVKEMIWDLIVWPIVRVVGAIANFLYTVLVWPWIFAAGLL